MVQIAPAVALAISAATTAAAAGVSYAQQRAAAKYQEDVARQNAAFQAKLTASNVARAKLAANLAEDAAVRDRRRKMSALRTAIGAAGVGFGGSPLEIVADSAATARRDIEVLKMNASQRIYDTSLQGQSQERQYLFDAQAAQFKGNEAFGTLLGGFGQAVGQGAGAWKEFQK
jgi:hypothetical protein